MGNIKKTHTLYRRAVCTIAALTLGVLVSACAPQESEHADEHAEHADEHMATVAAHVHEVEGETCFICDPAKRDKGRLWCNEHGSYEDRCWICHPGLEDKERLYCDEHSLYEDECFLCHPELKKDDTSSVPIRESIAVVKSETHAHTAAVMGSVHDSTAAEKSEMLWCNEHDVSEMECGICQPQRATELTPGQRLLVRMPSMNSARKAGIEVYAPRQSERIPGLTTLCEVHYNGNALTHVTPLADGIIYRVAADVGEKVETGQVLVELNSAEVAQAKSSYLSALVMRDLKETTLDRERKLAEETINAKKDYIAAAGDFRLARLAVNNARQKLLNLGLTEEAIAQIERTEDTSSLLAIRAPFSATLIARSAVTGQAVPAGETLFTLADLATRWLILSIPADRLGNIQIGQTVEARFDELPGEVIYGTLVWVDTEVDQRTRLVRARAVVKDGAERVKTGFFGQANILTQTAQAGFMVPREAVQRYEGQNFVFVQQEDDLYALQRVQLGGASERSVEVFAGLQPDDAVVASGALVMSEFLKSRLGAGCVDH